MQDINIICEIEPGIFIGNRGAALHNWPDFDYIVNVTREVPFPPGFLGQRPKRAAMRVAVFDIAVRHEIDTMLESLLEMVPKVFNLVKSGKRVLVHCNEGRQRS